MSGLRYSRGRARESVVPFTLKPCGRGAPFIALIRRTTPPDRKTHSFHKPRHICRHPCDEDKGEPKHLRRRPVHFAAPFFVVFKDFTTGSPSPRRNADHHVSEHSEIARSATRTCGRVAPAARCRNPRNSASAGGRTVTAQRNSPTSAGACNHRGKEAARFTVFRFIVHPPPKPRP